jgi:hypothetical protein
MRATLRRTCTAGILALALAACSVDKMARKMAPQDVQAAAEEAMTDLRAGHFDILNQRLVGSLRGQDHSGDFRRMAGFVPPDGELSSHIAGYFLSTGPSATRYEIVYEYQFAHTWVVARYVWIRSPSRLGLAEMHVNSQADSLEERNAFSLRGLRPAQFVVLVLGPLAALVSLYAVVKCLRMRGLRLKGLWVPFILVGFGGFAVNWANGDWQVVFFQARLLSFSAFAHGGQPWFVTASVPVGAAVFLDHRRKRKAAAAKVTAPPPL